MLFLRTCRWIYIPQDCYLHIYPLEEAAARLNGRWVSLWGDSNQQDLSRDILIEGWNRSADLVPPRLTDNRSKARGRWGRRHWAQRWGKAKACSY